MSDKEEKQRELDGMVWGLVELIADSQFDTEVVKMKAARLVKERNLVNARWEVQVSTDMGDSWYEVASSKARKYTNKQEAVADACGWAATVHPNNYKIYRVVRAERMKTS